MTVSEFFKKYLNGDAIVCLCEENGNINYTGKLDDAPFWTWSARDLIRIEGIGSENDIIIWTSERKRRNKK